MARATIGWRPRLRIANGRGVVAFGHTTEIFHNKKRRHSSLGMLTPAEYETLHSQQPIVA
jgi:putative transposase